jgi:uncharacterized protein (TIGR04222 family)
MAITTQHTWGISGPMFLVLYAIAFAITLGVSEWRRRRILEDATNGRTPSLAELDPCEIALVAQDARDARTVALLALECEHVVEIENATAGTLVRSAPDESAASSKRRARHERTEWLQQMQNEAEQSPRVTTITTTGAGPDPGACPLERAIAELVWESGEVTLETIEADPTVVERLGMLRADLVARGFLLDDAIVTRLRVARVVWAPLVALGTVRLITGIDNHRPVQFLVLALLATIGCVFGRTLPTTPFSIAHELKELDDADLRNHAEAAFSGDGAAPSVADLTALAVTGVALLWTANSAYAVSLAVPYPTSSSSSWWSGCGGCGCGGCGGCA